MTKLPAGWKKAAAAILVVAAAWFIYRTIAANWSHVRAYPWQVRPALLVASVLALTAVLAWGVFVWSRVLARFEHPPVEIGTLQRIWFLSNLARYIPGTVFQFVTAAQLSRGAGLSAAVLLTSLLVQTGVSVVSAVVVAAWTVTHPLFPALPDFALGAICGGVTAAAVLAVHPRVLNGALGVIPRLLKKEVIRWNGSWGYGVGVLALSMVSWAVYGVAYFAFIRSITPVSAAHLPLLTGVNSLSFVAGWVVFIAPGGAGVRESAMTQLLVPVFPAGVAGVVSIAARLWNVAGELLGGVLVLALTRSGAPREAAAEHRAG